MQIHVVLDLDGTLIDSTPDIHGITNRLLAAGGLNPIDLATARGFIGRGAQTFVDQLAQASGLSPQEEPALLAEFLADYDSAVTLTHPYPGVEGALNQLARQARLGICTKKPHCPHLAVLWHLKLDRFFAAVLGGDSLPVRKPDSLPLREPLLGWDRAARSMSATARLMPNRRDRPTFLSCSSPLAIARRRWPIYPMRQPSTISATCPDIVSEVLRRQPA